MCKFKMKKKIKIADMNQSCHIYRIICIVLFFSFFDNNSLAQTGINIDPPLSTVHVNGGILSTGNSEGTMISGGGTRFMWIPEKRAIRAGYVSGDYWDDSNIGDYSFSAGNDIKSAGEGAICFGNGIQSAGKYSLCIGEKSLAPGNYTVNFGIGTSAESYCSMIIGKYNIISGTYDSWISSDTLFAIGIGENNSSRLNAFTVLKNGNSFFNADVSTDGNLKNAGVYKINNDSILFVSSSSTNTHAGSQTASANTGSMNTFLGYSAGLKNNSGINNTVLGSGAGYWFHDAEYNTFAGMGAGFSNMYGGVNTFIGVYSGEDNINGNYNTYAGVYSGRNSDGSNNVFLGYKAGYNEYDSDELHINNSETNSLISGDFSSNMVAINQSIPQFATLYINGNMIADSFIGDGSALTNLNIGSNYWDKSPGILSCDTLNIGAGLQNPEEKLHSQGKIKTEGNIFLNGNFLCGDGDNEGLVIDNDGNTGVEITESGAKLFVNGKMKTENNFDLNGNYLSGDGDEEGLFVTSNGSAGIGSTTPAEQIEITGSFQMPTGSSGTAWAFYKGNQRFIFNYQPEYAATDNTFSGLLSGSLSIVSHYYFTYLGSANVAFGAVSLTDIIAGYENTALGTRSLKSLTSDGENVSVGYRSMEESFSNRNTAIGNYALFETQGDNSIAIGYMAGKNQTSGNGNIVIGPNEDLPSLSGSDQLNIGGLIYGNLSLDRIGIALNDPQAGLHVNGDLKLETGHSLNEISADTSLASESDMALVTEKSIKNYTDYNVDIQPNVPLGAIIAWTKDLTGVSNLDTNFVECNGQVLNDDCSPLNGQVIPDLNAHQASGSQRFLRGSDSSGSTGGSEQHVHQIDNNTGEATVKYTDLEGCAAPSDCTTRAKEDHLHNIDLDTESTSSLPSYYEVVWVMRVK